MTVAQKKKLFGYHTTVMKPFLLSTLFLSCCLATALQAAELETLENATLIEAGLNDGDSFKVQANGKVLHLRLYYVDCLETSAGKSDMDTIIEQQYHFGLQDHTAVTRFGKQATAYVKRVLSRPFTVHTRYAVARGRSATVRYYAFVETHDGRDLGHLLVEQGLARVHGKPRQAPDGTPSKFVWKELRNVLDFAILKRNGIWKEADPKLLIQGRKILLEDEKKKEEEWEQWKQWKKKKCDTPINLNTASQEQFEQLPGIGPVTAAKITAGRPYRSVDDLLNIPGIGKKTLKKMRPCVTVGK